MGFLDQLKKKPAAPAELDRLSLKQLRKRGADLARPRHVLHFLYFADQTSAQSAAATLSAGGYDTTVGPPDDSVAAWLVRAETTRVVDETTVPAYRHWFEHVADAHGGEYDGWEAATKP